LTLRGDSCTFKILKGTSSVFETSIWEISVEKDYVLRLAAGSVGQSMGLRFALAGRPVPKRLEPITQPGPSARFDLFISYASEDRAACVEPLVAMLEARGLKAWLDIHEIVLGDSIIEKVHEGISESAMTLLLVSESYLAKSWPLKEIRVVLAKHISSQGVVVPVFLGVSSHVAHDAIPLLSDIKHASICDYNPETRVPERLLNPIADAIAVAHDRRVGMTTYPMHNHTPRLSEPVQVVRYERGYQSIWVSGLTSAIDCVITPEDTEDVIHHIAPFSDVVKLDSILSALFEEEGVQDIPHVTATAIVGNLLVLTLASGRCVWGGCGYFRSGRIGNLAVVETGAARDPLFVRVTATLDLVFGYASGQVQVCPYGTTQPRALVTTGQSPVVGIETSLQSTLFVAEQSGTVGIWAIDGFTLLKSLVCGESPISSLAVKTVPNDRIFATGHVDGTISTWSFDGDQIARVSLGDTGVTNLKFLPTPGRLIAAAAGNVVHVVNCETAAVLSSLTVRASSVSALDIEIYGRMGAGEHVVIVAAYDDGSIAAWDAWRS
jgi:hypothetical protein